MHLLEVESYHALASRAYVAIPVDAATGQKTAQTPVHLWEFWRSHYIILPFWWSIAQRVGILLSSSCCSERLFAVYTSMFDAQQLAALEDRIELAVSRRFNNNKRQQMELDRL